MEKTIILGREFDPELRKSVMDTVRQLGATIEAQDSVVAGSQEIDTVVVVIAGREVTIEAETYIGLSVTGDKEIIDRIAERVGLANRDIPS